MVYDLIVRCEAELATINAISALRLALPMGLVHSQGFFIHRQNGFLFGNIV
jgi:hypothetical protein